MAIEKVLEDWSEYDNKKKKYTDASFFACTETWEVDYLIGKIKKAFPRFSSEEIKKAIEKCCKTVGAPHPRKPFVQCVLGNLGV